MSDAKIVSPPRQGRKRIYATLAARDAAARARNMKNYDPAKNRMKYLRSRAQNILRARENYYNDGGIQNLKNKLRYNQCRYDLYGHERNRLKILEYEAELAKLVAEREKMINHLILEDLNQTANEPESEEDTGDASERVLRASRLSDEKASDDDSE